MSLIKHTNKNINSIQLCSYKIQIFFNSYISFILGINIFLNCIQRYIQERTHNRQYGMSMRINSNLRAINITNNNMYNTHISFNGEMWCGDVK